LRNLKRELGGDFPI